MLLVAPQQQVLLLRLAAQRSLASLSTVGRHGGAWFSSSAPEKEVKGIPYNKLIVGIPKETFPLEKRVAATPESVARLIQPGFSVQIESGAGNNSYFSDADYEKAGATIVPDVFTSSDIVLKVNNAT
jgi:Alanine dehydrogenase/PNT, N-terminal domain